MEIGRPARRRKTTGVSEKSLQLLRRTPREWRNHCAYLCFAARQAARRGRATGKSRRATLRQSGCRTAQFPGRCRTAEYSGRLVVARIENGGQCLLSRRDLSRTDPVEKHEVGENQLHSTQGGGCFAERFADLRLQSRLLHRERVAGATVEQSATRNGLDTPQRIADATGSPHDERQHRIQNARRRCLRGGTLGQRPTDGVRIGAHLARHAVRTQDADGERQENLRRRHHRAAHHRSARDSDRAGRAKKIRFWFPQRGQLYAQCRKGLSNLH